MQLSEHFTLAELTHSNTAIARGIKNEPNAKQLANLKELARRAEIMRAELGKSMKSNSGLRVPELNKAVGGASQSQHMTGGAADWSTQGHSRLAMVRAALKAGFTGIGLGRNFLHTDIRSQSFVTVWEYQGGATAMWRAELGSDPVATVKRMARGLGR